ncbi:MAG: calcium-binding protein [Hormoscilla sp.]
MATIAGTPDDDFLLGTLESDIILAARGNDNIDGSLGNDTIFGGKDNDFVYGAEGFDELYGDLGDDTVLGGNGLDLIYGGEGNDLLEGNQENDVLFGNEGNDTIAAGESNDRVRAGKDNDLVLGGTGRDTLFGDLGDDIVYGGKDNDSIRGGKGDDQLFGDLGDDSILGDLGDDTVFGGDGDDSIGGGSDSSTEDGNDRLFGEAGDDTIFGRAGDDILSGGDDNDLLLGGNGRDEISGDAGNDTIFGGRGADTFTGGAGRDSFTITATSGGATIAEADVVLDFQNGQDFIGLAEGLSFADLEITQGTGENANDTIVRQLVDDTPGNYLLVLKNVNAIAIGENDFINIQLPEETDLDPDPDPDPTPPTGDGPRIVGAEVLVANSSTPSGNLAQLIGTDASGFTISSATGNSGQNVLEDFNIQGSNLRLVDPSVLDAGISGNSSVNLTIASLDASGETDRTSQFRVYRDIDDAIDDSAISDNSDISDGTGQDTVLVASGTYADENLPSSSTTTLRFSSLNQFTLIPNDLPQIAGNIDEVLVGTENGNNLTGDSGNDLFLGGGGADTLTGRGGENYFIFTNPSDGGSDGDRIDEFTTDDLIFVEAIAFGLTETGDRGTLRTTRFEEGNDLDAANPANDTTDDVRFVYDNANALLYFDSNGDNAGGGRLMASLPNDFNLTNDNIVVFPEIN